MDSYVMDYCNAVINAISELDNMSITKDVIGIKHSISKVLNVELANYLMYLCASDGIVKEREAQLIGDLLGYNFSPGKIVEIVKEDGLYSEDFESTVPVFIKALVQVDNHMAKQGREIQKPFSMMGIDIFKAYGLELIRIDGVVHENEIEDYDIYTQMLENYVMKSLDPVYLKAIKGKTPKIYKLKDSYTLITDPSFRLHMIFIPDVDDDHGVFFQQNRNDYSERIGKYRRVANKVILNFSDSGQDEEYYVEEEYIIPVWAISGYKVPDEDRFDLAVELYNYQMEFSRNGVIVKTVNNDSTGEPFSLYGIYKRTDNIIKCRFETEDIDNYYLVYEKSLIETAYASRETIYKVWC